MKKYNIVPILFSALTFILLLGLLTPTFLFVANHIENLPEKEESTLPDGTSQSPSPSAPNP
ncbi:MAG: hypothetical protein IJY89_03595, partial [Clostridia bacterium]|nr:hypothetical protein [Clostridia bacterium]